MGHYISHNKPLQVQRSLKYGSDIKDLPIGDADLVKLIGEAKEAKHMYTKDLEKIVKAGHSRSAHVVVIKERLAYLSGIIAMGRYVNGNWLNLDHKHPLQDVC